MYRRLPVYLLIDCSESMAGEAIDSVKTGLNTLIMDLRGNPTALETACLSVITFATVARELVPLTDLLAFQIPNLRMGSGTCLGAALKLWLQRMATDVVKTTATQKGDYKPICFLMTDGDPTDAWESAADEVKNCLAARKATVIAVACGADADVGKLRRITDTVLLMKDAKPGAFSEFFRWVSASISTASQKLDASPAQSFNLPPPPEVVQIAEGTSPPAPPSQDRQIFFHARCVNTRGFYIMRYAKGEAGGFLSSLKGPVYRGVAAHKVDDFDFESGAQAGKPKVSSTNLIEHPHCPYCENTVWGMCPQGHVHCCPDTGGAISLTCPWCGVTNMYGVNQFDVGRGAG